MATNGTLPAWNPFSPRRVPTSKESSIVAIAAALAYGMGTLTIIGHSHREESNMGDRRRRLIGICAFLALAGSLAACYGRAGGGQVSD
jgi:hypothetical protein